MSEDFHYHLSVIQGVSKYAQKYPNEVKKYCIDNDDGHTITIDDQIHIANVMYGYHTVPGQENGNKYNGDGWRFRGRGLLQMTGRDGYDKVQSIIDAYLGKNVVNIIPDNPPLLKAATAEYGDDTAKVNAAYTKEQAFDDNKTEKGFTMQQAVVSGLAEWCNYGGLFNIADRGINLNFDKNHDIIVNEISKKYATDQSSYPKRREYFKKMFTIFQVEKCPNYKGK